MSLLKNSLIYIALEKNSTEPVPEFKHSIKHPMIWAVQYGHLDIVKLLFHEDKKFAQERDEENQTPLLMATIKGQLDIVKFLLQELPSLICCRTLNKTSKNGITPLDWACSLKYTEITQVLSQHMIKNGSSVLNEMLDRIKDHIWLSKQALTLPFFGSHYHLTPLLNRLSDISNNPSTLVRIEITLQEIVKEHNLLIPKHPQTAAFLASLLKNSIINFFGHDRCLSYLTDGSLGLNENIFNTDMEFLRVVENKDDTISSLQVNSHHI